MDMQEKQLSSRYMFEGKIMKARLDEALLPNGKTAAREVCEHVGGVGVLALDQQGKLVLVRQFRYPYGETMLEIPAGKLDHGAEDAAACGARELEEETGCKAAQLVSLGQSYPSPGFLTEVLHLFAAIGVSEGEARPDEDEFVEVVRLTPDEVERMIAQNEIRDAKTIVALYRAKLKGLI